MTARSAFLIVAAFLTVCAGGATAQQKLGDLVAEGGYEWIIGRWAASTDEGKVGVEYKWGLDKNVVFSELKMGDYRNRGIIMLDPSRGEAVETVIDNKGGYWKGTWAPDGEGLVTHVEYTTAGGEVHKGDVVYTKAGDDALTVAMYRIDENGTRGSDPVIQLTYKRQPAATAIEAASTEQAGPTTDYQKLGDLVSEGGYEWLTGKWVATDESQKYQLEHSWALDKHAILMDLKLGDFIYHGMVMYVPARQEIVQVGADNQGGMWRGTWEEGSEGPTHKVKYTGPDGTTREMEHVYVKVANDEFQVKEYSQGSGQPGRTYTFKRQKPATP